MEREELRKILDKTREERGKVRGVSTQGWLLVKILAELRELNKKLD